MRHKPLDPLNNDVRNLNKGFTLIEILLMIMILTIIASIAIRIYSNYSEFPRQNKTQQTILMIENAMKYYKLDNGFYPTTSQGISALVVKPKTDPIPKHWTQYLTTFPRDQHGKPYHYANPGKYKEIDIYSDAEGIEDSASWWVKLKRLFGN